VRAPVPSTVVRKSGQRDHTLKVTNEHVRSCGRCERWRLAGRGDCVLAHGRRSRRCTASGGQNGDGTFDATVSNVLSEFPEARRFGSRPEKNSVGPRPASRVLVSSVLVRVA
jgi:hypothetical protein